MNRGLSIFVRDNLEAFAVAIALALVVRHFSLEAFRIPSKSMMPTLIGSERGGDRILVDKYRWLFGDPHRWEPVVFHYPLNRSKNFIKRLVGMPGERLKVDDGDIWTSRDGGTTWKIERKPADPQEALFFPYYPEPVEERDWFADRQEWEAGPGWQIDEGEGRFVVDAREESALRFLADVVQYGSEGIMSDARLPEAGGSAWGTAGDTRVRFDLAVERAGTLVVSLSEHGLARRLVLAPEGSHAVVVSPGGEKRFPIDVRLRDGMDLSISFANVDDTLLVRVDGDAELETSFPFAASAVPDVEEMRRTASRIENEGDLQEAARVRTEAEALERKLEEGRHRVVFEAEGVKAAIEEIRIDRDVCYTQDGEWLIPEGHYFMLGDNTNSSKDSRAWRIAEVYLKDGTVVRWEERDNQQPGDVPGQPNATFDIHGPDQVIEVKADIDGLVRRFHTKDVDRVKRGVHWGVVSRDHLVGRAFAIFWPIYVWPVVKSPTRVGLIR